jgi:hypothetical protein
VEPIPWNRFRPLKNRTRVTDTGRLSIFGCLSHRHRGSNAAFHLFLRPMLRSRETPLVVMGDSLTGHVILIADPRVGRFVQDLQGALELRGAETLTVQQPATAFDRMREFHFSAAVLSYDDASDALETLIYGLGDIPILLYGNEAASAASKRKVPHVAFVRSDVEAIASALGGLLRTNRH